MEHPEPDEEFATKEERMAWLRARGVRIEEPGQQTGPSLTGDGRSFIFVTWIKRVGWKRGGFQVFL